jgi:hypothetical protein
MAPISPQAAAATASQKRSAPILALSVEQACEALGVSWDTWRADIEPDMRLVRLGRGRQRQREGAGRVHGPLENRGHDLYGHLMPGNESEAAGLLDAYLAAQQGQAAMV